MNGFFLGGAATGIADSRDAQLKRDALAQELGLKTRGLDLQERQIAQEAQLGNRRLDLTQRGLDLTESAQKNAQARDLLARVDKGVSDTMAIVKETIEAGFAGGHDPAKIAAAIQPLVASAKSIAAKGGRDPGALDVQVNALMARPTAVEKATTEGQAAKAKTLAEKGPTQPGVLPGDPTPDEKNRLSKMTVSYRVLDQELQDFGKLIEKQGVSLLPGTPERVRYDASRRNIQMQMKELYNLGVLNGPDLALMDQMLIDPTVSGGRTAGEGGSSNVSQDVLNAATAPVRAMYKSFVLQKSAKANVGMLRDQMKRLFEANRDVIMRVPPRQEQADPLGIR